MNIQKMVVMVLAAMAAAEVMAVQGKLTTEQETLSGDIRWQSGKKQYVISVKKGKTLLDMERSLSDVVSLDIPEPEGFAKAVAEVESGNAAAAANVLQKIVSDYRMLVWDKKAARYLVFAQLAAGNAQKAVEACETLIKDDKSAAYSGDLAPAYWEALLKLGRNDQIEKLLKKAATSGDRTASAAALVMRGDMIVAAANDNAEQLKAALADGYMRVVLMYQDEACVKVRKDALTKAAVVFDKLGQGARAEKLRAQAKML